MRAGTSIRVSLRIDFGSDFRLGPGKIELLEAIGQTGSISAAGRLLGMSYRRAWVLVESLNCGFKRGVVETALGGKSGGGAKLTDTGCEVIARYRSLEHAAVESAAPDLKRLIRLLAPPPRG